MTRETVGALAAAGALLLCSCAKKAYRSPNLEAKNPRSVVVLPFDNETTSLDAPERLRKMVAERLGHLSPGLSIENVDERLRGVGVTDGGQLRSVASKKLGEALGTDGLLYGTVEEFKYQNLGFVSNRVVKLRLKLVHAASGERLWEAVGRHAKGNVTLDKKKAGKAFVRGIVRQAAETALRVPLMRESRRAVEKALRNYPRR
ncbi:MAG: GNA1162 family protein [Elusimicrobiota bacterium]